ncbi:gamma-glutamyl-gamma-aminobutyrate hydrolase family protein [bacterium]|nr:gamma-glutamyl-gamma-aminobutyrate hydrolase family protein [bacterium]
MKPLIGIIANNDLNRFKMPTNMIPLAYTSCIEQADGIPVILPFTKNRNILPAMIEHIQGVLFPGGNDIEPEFYNEPPDKKLGEVDKDLDLFQIEVLNLAIAQKKPVLGICRGIQIVNVALGGTLIQDIPTHFNTPTLRHMQKTISFDTDHEIKIVPGSRLYELFGTHIMVNSRHHQSIKNPGKGLVVTALAPDGVIEAAQHKTLPIDLVQWHPELMMQKNKDMLPLFKTFIQKCKKQ